ncbi:MAG TPA: hypothetical protein VNG29_01435 [Candidatus Paceibacterota bacterium]|nr:hypothetical protein [Candidatus Paceibacterota bacterium]
MKSKVSLGLTNEPTSQRANELSHSGQATLSTVLLIGGIIVGIGILLVFLALSFLNSSYAYRASARAESVAQSGVYDALVQLDRDSSLTTSIYSYSLPVGSDTAMVSVTWNSSADQFTISSTATVALSTKTILAVTSADPTTGQIFLSSWKEQ